MRIPKQGTEGWCPHTYQGLSSSTGACGGVPTWRSEEETGQAWCGWGFGWWSYTAHAPDCLPERGHCWGVGQCSQSLYSLVHGPSTATSQWEPQCHSTLMEGAHSKVPVKPSTAQCWPQCQIKGIPDPVNLPCWWIKAEMDRVGAHPHWWKEISAFKKYTLEGTLKRYTVGEDLKEPKAFYFSQWQDAAFRLPLLQTGGIRLMGYSTMF